MIVIRDFCGISPLHAAGFSFILYNFCYLQRQLTSTNQLVYNTCMTKTFICKELGGICDEKFTGSTFKEIVQKATPHMMNSDEHKENLMKMQVSTNLSRAEWMAKMEKEFEDREEDK